MSTSNNDVKEYGASSIQILEGLEPVRKRPGMYIGSTGAKGLHHLIWEIVDNSIDEAAGGFADTITVSITKDNSIKVEDNGRGVPIEEHEKTHKSTVETVFTVLHAGGKFDNNTYKVSGGLHGVGASVVNALSQWMRVWVKRDNKLYFIEFNNGGQPKEELKEIAEVTGTGTIVEFYPDFTIMEKHDWNVVEIKERLKQLAYLNRGLKIILIDERVEPQTADEWQFKGGLIEYVKDLNANKKPITSDIFYFECEDKVKAASGNSTYSIKIECSLQWNETFDVNSVYSFCNNIFTKYGGTHLIGFSNALVRTMNRYLKNSKNKKQAESLLIESDVYEGLVAIISIKHPNPQYEGQTKETLGNEEVKSFVSARIGDALEKFLMENPDFGAIVLEKNLRAQEGRIEGTKARELSRRKSPFESNGLPGKLADCSSKNKEICELYLVEGDSAGGSAKLGRDREYQAILPLRGKVINVEKAATAKIFDNAEIKSMISVIGTGVAENDFQLEKLRYNKIVIMTDADVDGAHIRILLLTFFFRKMPKLIENGNIYIANPPLYKFTKGKDFKYAYSDEELELFKKEAGPAKYTVQRYKGLGEMNPQQLWETTMDPETRSLFKVSIENAILADQVFSQLMGLDTLPRKEFIEANAKFVKNLDI